MTDKGFRVVKSLITSGSTQETCTINVPLGQTVKWLMAAFKINAIKMLSLNTLSETSKPRNKFDLRLENEPEPLTDGWKKVLHTRGVARDEGGVKDEQEACTLQ